MREILFLKDYKIVLQVEHTIETADLDCDGRVALAGDIDFDWVLIEQPQKLGGVYSAHKKIWDGIWYTMDRDFVIISASDTKRSMKIFKL